MIYNWLTSAVISFVFLVFKIPNIKELLHFAIVSFSTKSNCYAARTANCGLRHNDKRMSQKRRNFTDCIVLRYMAITDPLPFDKISLFNTAALGISWMLLKICLLNMNMFIKHFFIKHDLLLKVQSCNLKKH